MFIYAAYCANRDSYMPSLRYASLKPVDIRNSSSAASTAI